MKTPANYPVHSEIFNLKYFQTEHMGWQEEFWRLGHDMFLVFIELKIIGSWTKSPQYDLNKKGDFMVSTGHDAGIEFIAPDGLRRHMAFKADTTITIRQNILTYGSKTVEEIAVDENEQAGKGKTRTTLH